MIRKAKQQDIPILKAIWQQAFGDDGDFVQQVFDNFSGFQNVVVAVEDDQPVAMLCAVPVQCKGRRGAYFYGLCTREDYRGRGIMTQLMESTAKALAFGDCDFITLIPANKKLFGYYEARGYEKAFGLRRVRREIQRNLWAQAQFDEVTAQKLRELRREYAPEAVMLPAKSMRFVLADLYAAGITVVSEANGYGLYFTRGDTMEFIEMFARSGLAAQRLMQAAREKTGCEWAELTLGEETPLFLGEGHPMDYGMIRFLREPFDLRNGYMRLMLDND